MPKTSPPWSRKDARQYLGLVRRGMYEVDFWLATHYWAKFKETQRLRGKSPRFRYQYFMDDVEACPRCEVSFCQVHLEALVNFDHPKLEEWLRSLPPHTEVRLRTYLAERIQVKRRV